MDSDRETRRSRGRPSLEIDTHFVFNRLNQRYSLTAMAEELGVSALTLTNRLREVGETYIHNLPRAELIEAIDDTIQLSESGRHMGHRLVQAALFRSAGISAPRHEVLEALREHDPAGLAARQERILPRRTYDVIEGMYIWHIDSYEKLKPYGFYVHGGIDEGSNFVVYATVALHKEASALFAGYRQAVRRYGRPFKVRADMCFEAAAMIGADIIEHKGENAYLRTENLWNFVWAKWASYYKGLFQSMDRDGLLDRHLPSDLYSLTAAFYGHMQHALLEKCRAWNYHTVRPQASRGIHSYVPAHVFQRGFNELRRLSAEEIRAAAARSAGRISSAEEGHSFENSNASDRAERLQQSSSFADPLSSPFERSVRAAVMRQLVPEWHRRAEEQRAEDCVQYFIVHKQVLKVIICLRAYHASGIYEWASILQECQAGLQEEAALELQYVIQEGLYDRRIMAWPIERRPSACSGLMSYMAICCPSFSDHFKPTRYSSKYALSNPFFIHGAQWDPQHVEKPFF